MIEPKQYNVQLRNEGDYIQHQESTFIPMQSENLSNNDKRALSPQIAYLTTTEASKHMWFTL